MSPQTPYEGSPPTAPKAPATGRTSRRIRAIGAAVALVLGAAVIAAFAIDDRSTSNSIAAADDTDRGGHGEGDGGAAETSTDTESGAHRSDSATAQTQDPSAEREPSGELGEAQNPGPPAAPAPGKYTYRTVTDDGEESTSQLKIVDVDRSAAVTIQEHRGTNRGHSDDVTEWTADRVVTRQTTYRFGGDKGECKWKPELIQLRLPFAAGSSWSNNSTCTITGLGPAPTTVQRTESATVVTLERRRIAGEVLDLWVIEEEATVDLSGFTVTGTTTRWFSPRHGLTVRTEALGTTGGPGSKTESFTSEVQNLQPTT